MGFSSYNSDPNSNLTISGINIAEGCPPSGINNAIRQIMADAKAENSATVKNTGAQTVSGAATFASSITVASAATISGATVCKAGATISGGAIVSGTTQLRGATVCSSSLTVASAATISGATAISGGATITSGINMGRTGTILFSRSATIGGVETYHSGCLTLNENSLNFGLFDYTNSTWVIGAGPAGNVWTNSPFSMTSGATISGGATVSGGMVVNGTISGTVTNATSASSAGYATSATKDGANHTIASYYCPLSDDATITGTYTHNSYIIMGDSTSIDATGWSHSLALRGYHVTGNYNYGASIYLRGMSASTYPGSFRIISADGANTYVLYGTDSGALTWNGKTVSTTSDERKKTPMQDIPDTVLDAWEDVQWGQFKYLASIEKKQDAARLHTGVIAQAIVRAFEAHGLDATAYGIVCHEVHDATDEEPAVDIWTVRYSEAQAVEAAYQRRRADRLEARIAALEARLGE